ncbi:MAG: ComEA family DNA-binding protein [Nocardioidaceae bacterium]|nr:ComEA family DNA-binding protein [Nocardioidaceae bacterium]MCL2614142.1 ComEA family DNA-binding protein [Nocardioidaceae bacterium]
MHTPRLADPLVDATPPADRAALRLARLAAAIDGGPTGPTEAGEDDPGSLVARPDWWVDHTRVADRPGAGDAGGEAVRETPAVASVVPMPGRHASRRRETGLVEAVRTRLPPMPALPTLGAQHLALVALLLAVAIGGVAWWLLRDRGSEEALPTAGAAAPLASSGASAAAVIPGEEPLATSAPQSSASSAGAGSVTVDVVGRVRHPGIAVLHQGARVVDAIKAAGGVRHGVDLSGLNLARVLTDGEQIAVGVAGSATVPDGSGSAGVPGAGAVPGGLVNLNTATEQQLEALPEVGPVTAQAILAWRQQNGAFTSVDQLLDVQGIGDKTLAQLTPYVTV